MSNHAFWEHIRYRSHGACITPYMAITFGQTPERGVAKRSNVNVPQLNNFQKILYLK